MKIIGKRSRGVISLPPPHSPPKKKKKKRRPWCFCKNTGKLMRLAGKSTGSSLTAMTNLKKDSNHGSQDFQCTSEKPGLRSSPEMPSFTKEQLDYFADFYNINSKPVNLTLPLPPLLFPNMNVPSDSTDISSWIIDSGASDHMTWNSHFSLLTFLLQGNKKVKVADSPFSAIAGKKTVKLALFFLTLLKFLHVPKWSHNLLSISKLTQNLNSCKVSGRMIGNARES